MDDFLQKWQEDKKFRAKIKLLLYVLFALVITIYAVSLNKSNQTPLEDNSNQNNDYTAINDKITIPEEYNYIIEIKIDNDEYMYTGEKRLAQTIIDKTANNITTNYILKDNEYYVKDNDLFVKTTKDEVYDVINYNYIDLNTINNYLEHAVKDNNQYLVYLKDIILDNDTNDYFIILINDNLINIDYTPLMKQFNSNINNYKVNIQINEIE